MDQTIFLISYPVPNRHRWIFPIFKGAISLILGVVFSQANGVVRYQLEAIPSQGVIVVSLTVSNPAPAERFFIPAWAPGHYKITNFQENIRELTASDSSGRKVQLSHPSPREWVITGSSAGPLTLRYTVAGDELGLGIFGVHVDSRTAFINGPAAFIYAQNRKSESIELSVKVPSTWQIACPLDRAENGNFRAEDYDELVDSPIQLGEMQRRSFNVEGRPIETIWVLPDEPIACDITVETERLRLISESAVKLMAATPFRRYIFFVHLNPTGFNGGLEHRASSVLAIANRPNLEVDHLAAHEIFHAWNGKIIRPAVLGPFDYQRAAPTGNLWFVEGVTDYFASHILFRSGLISATQLVDEFTAQVTQLQISRARRDATMEVASREIWNSNTDGFKDLSIYNKGYLAGLLLDCMLRSSTQGRSTLLALMEDLYARCVATSVGYSEDDIRKAVSRLAGTDCTAAYSAITRSTSELPYGFLSAIGLRAILAGNYYEDASGTRFQANDFRVELDPHASFSAKMLRDDYFRRP